MLCLTPDSTGRDGASFADQSHVPSCLFVNTLPQPSPDSGQTIVHRTASCASTVAPPRRHVRPAIPLCCERGDACSSALCPSLHVLAPSHPRCRTQARRCAANHRYCFSVQHTSPPPRPAANNSRFVLQHSQALDARKQQVARNLSAYNV